MHIHQYAVYPDYCYWGEEEKREPVHRVKAGPHFHKVMDSLEQVFFMQKPKNFSEGNKASALFQNNVRLPDLGYISPIYIKH